MSCQYSRETLALFVENDLVQEEMDQIGVHVSRCEACRETCAALQRSQSFIRVRLKMPNASPDAEMLAAVRQSVLSQIERTEKNLGWGIRLERALLCGFRNHRYAFAGVAISAILSVSLWAQMRQTFQPAPIAAVFEGSDTLLRPAGYRDWVRVGSANGRLYVDPIAYKAFTQTGAFPEGAVLVREGAPSNGHGALDVSVKDSRFDGGWGFFEFVDKKGIQKTKAPIAESCRYCHEGHPSLG
ncbi:MAG TPA: cytochrome P460 family protein [Terriglobia bacterium]|nr:cytochrome P460 family protein [Terriglobia bacterium]